jgi:hypothetical protein
LRNRIRTLSKAIAPGGREWGRRLRRRKRASEVRLSGRMKDEG